MSGADTGARSASDSGEVQETKVIPTGSSGAKRAYGAVKGLRILIGLVLWIPPLAYFALFMIGGFAPANLKPNPLLNFAQAICLPAVQAITSKISFRTAFHGWDFLLFVLAGVAVALRQVVLLPLKSLEAKLKKKIALKPVILMQGDAPGSDRAVRSSRMSMLRDYHETREILFKQKRHLAFLSIDVVGSTKMKAGEDKLTIEHAFAEYKKFVERILKTHHIWKVAWTPDGIMCAFQNANDCVGAAQDLLRDLPWFNDGVHHLRTPFNVRCGANEGEVVFPDNKAMEEISDEVIDVAGHMQKYAAHGALWLTDTMIGKEVSADGFRAITDQEVDGHKVMEWRADGLGAAAARGASTPAG